MARNANISPPRHNAWTSVRLFFVIFVPLVVLFSSILALIAVFKMRKEREIQHTNELHQIELRKELIEAELEMIVSDVLIQAEQNDLKSFLQQGRKQHLEYLELEFIAFLRARGIYDQIRLLDEKGKELIRINNPRHRGQFA